MQVHYLYDNGKETVLEPSGQVWAVLRKKVEEGHYFLNLPLNNRSLGVDIRLSVSIPSRQMLEVYNRTNIHANNREGYKISVVNMQGELLQIKLSIYRRDKFKLWREIEIPAQGSKV
jgi:hypothetical protein